MSVVTDNKTKKSYVAKEIFIEKADSEYNRDLIALTENEDRDIKTKNNKKREDRPKWEACYHLGLAETDRQVSLSFNRRKQMISKIRCEENDETMEFEYDVFECTQPVELKDNVQNLMKQYSGTIVIVMEKENQDLKNYLSKRLLSSCLFMQTATCPPPSTAL